MELLLRDVTLHWIEAAIVVILFAVSVLGSMTIAVLFIAKAADKGADNECADTLQEETVPECLKTCSNIRPECSSREEACSDYVAVRRHAVYNPNTGEVERT